MRLVRKQVFALHRLSRQVSHAKANVGCSIADEDFSEYVGLTITE